MVYLSLPTAMVRTMGMEIIDEDDEKEENNMDVWLIGVQLI